MCRQSTRGVWLKNSGFGGNTHMTPINAIQTVNSDKKRNWISDFMYTNEDKELEENFDDETTINKRVAESHRSNPKIEADDDSDDENSLWDQFSNTQTLLDENNCPHPSDMLISTADQSEMDVTCSICGKQWKRNSTIDSVFSPSRSEKIRMDEYGPKNNNNMRILDEW